MTIALVTTGGTIVSQFAADTGLAAARLGGAELLGALGRFGPVGPVEVVDALKVSSPQIGLQDWCALQRTVAALLARPDIAGVVITHGTATMEETAWFLDLTLAADKPVVLTGAQRNASEPDSDGPRNLYNALGVCAAARPLGAGVMVALNDSVHAAREVAKTQTLNVETFQSGLWGALGQVRAGRVVFHRQPLRRLHVPLRDAPLPAVPIVPMYVGATRALVDAAVAGGAQGLVVEAIASGHVNQSLQDGILDALAAGVPVVVATRIPHGGTRVGYSFPGASHHLVAGGAVLSEDLSPWKARILLMLALQQGWRTPAALQGLFADDRVPAVESGPPA
nr:asparaginase [Variovorax boronicumulans]